MIRGGVPIPSGKGSSGRFGRTSGSTGGRSESAAATCVLAVFLGIFTVLVLASGVTSYDIGSSDGMEVVISEPVSGSSSGLVTDVAPSDVPSEWAVPGADCTLTIHLDTSEPDRNRKRTVVNLVGEPSCTFAETGESSMELRYRHDSYDLEINVTLDSVFWGWRGSDGNRYAPGQALPDVSGTLTLEAVWMKPNPTVASDSFRVIMDGEDKALDIGVSDRLTLSGSEPVPEPGTAFAASGGVSVLAFAGGYSPQGGRLDADMLYVDPVLITSEGAMDGTGGRTSLNIGKIMLSGDTRFEHISLVQSGVPDGSHGNCGDAGIFACGHELVMGEGIAGSGVQLFGGGSGTSVSGDTSVTVSSGSYSNIVGGSFGGSVTGTARMTVGSAEVADSVVGGSTGPSGDAGSTSVTLLGCSMPDGSLVVGGCDSAGVSGESRVRVAGHSDIYDITASGRTSASVTAVSVADIAGYAEVRGSVLGASPEGGTAGEVSVTVSGSASVGTVYGGGTGNTTITVDGGSAGGIYGGGPGSDVGTPGSPAGTISITVLSGTVYGDIVGGGSFSSVRASSVNIWVGTARVYGDVVGGGSGPDTVTDSDRRVTINGATVDGNVYGGSLSGTDGSQSANRTSTVAAVSGTIGGNVCGGGTGTSHLDSQVLLGTEAVKRSPAGPEPFAVGPLSIGSLFPGNDVGIPDGTDSLFGGSSVMRIGERFMTDGVQDKSAGTCAITVHGVIGGIRDSSDPGRSTSVYLDGCYNSQSEPLRSIQHVGYLEITNSDVFFGGAPRTGGGPNVQVSMADIGHLVFGGYTRVHLMADTSSIDSYSSLYDGRPQIKENTAQKVRNEVCVYNGRMFTVLGPGDSGTASDGGPVGTVTGYTLLSRVSDDGYYGAYALALDSSTGGFTMNNGKSPANVLEPRDGNVKTWFIAGHVSREYTVSFPSDSQSMELELRMYSLTGGSSSYVYNGCRTEPSSKDSLMAVAGTEGISGRGVYLGVTLGTVGGSGDMSFGGGNVAAVSHVYRNGSWQTAVSPEGTGAVGTGTLLGVGLDLLSEDIYTGMVGTLSFSFTEVTVVGDKMLPVNMLDYRVGLVMEPRGAPTGDTEVYVSAAGVLLSGSEYRASATLALPGLGAGYEYTLSAEGTAIGVSSFEVRNGRGWSASAYPADPLTVSPDSPTEAVIGTSGTGPVSLLLDFVFTTDSDKAVQTFRVTAASGVTTESYLVNVDLLSEVDMFFVCESRSDPANPGNAAEHSGVYKYVYAEGRGTQEDPYILSWREYVPGMSYDPDNGVKPFRFQFGSVPGGMLFSIRYDQYSAPSETTLDSALSSMVSRLNSEEGLPAEAFSYSDNYMGVYADPDMAVSYSFSSEIKGDTVLFAGFGLKVTFKADGLSLLVPQVMLKPGESLSDKGLANIWQQQAGPGDYISICPDYTREGYGITPVPRVAGGSDTMLSWVDERNTSVAYDFDAPCTRNVTLVVPWDPYDYTVRLVFDGVQPEQQYLRLTQEGPVKQGYTMNPQNVYSVQFDGLYALDLGTWYSGGFVSVDPGVSTDGSDPGRLLFGIGLSGGQALPEGTEFTVTVSVTEELEVEVTLSGADRYRFCDDPAAGVTVTVNGTILGTGVPARVDGSGGPEGIVRMEVSVSGDAAFALWNAAGPISQERQTGGHVFDLTRSQCDGLSVSVYNQITVGVERNTTAGGNKALPYVPVLEGKMGYNVTPIDLRGNPMDVMSSEGPCYNGYVVNICKTPSGAAPRVAFPTDVAGVSKVQVTDASGAPDHSGDYGKYTLDGTSQGITIVLHRAGSNIGVTVTFQLGEGVVPSEFLNGVFFDRYPADHEMVLRIVNEGGATTQYVFGKSEFAGGTLTVDATGKVEISVPSPRQNAVSGVKVSMVGFDVEDTTVKNDYSFTLTPAVYSLYFNGSASDPDTWSVTDSGYVIGQGRQTSAAMVVDGKPLWTCYSGTLTGLFSGHPDPLMFCQDPASAEYRHAHLNEYVQIRDVGLDPSSVRVVFAASMFKNGDVLIRSPGLFEDNAEFNSPGSKPVRFDVRSGNLVVPYEYRGFGAMVLLDPVHGYTLELVVVSGISDIQGGSFIIKLDSPPPSGAPAYQGSTELNQTV